MTIEAVPKPLAYLLIFILIFISLSESKLWLAQSSLEPTLLRTEEGPTSPSRSSSILLFLLFDFFLSLFCCLFRLFILDSFGSFLELPAALIFAVSSLSNESANSQPAEMEPSSSSESEGFSVTISQKIPKASIGIGKPL